MKIDFSIIKLIVQLILAVITLIAIPMLRKMYIDNTTEKQRQEILFWTKFAIRWAEELYKERGAGELKKIEVLHFLEKLGLNIDEEQLSVLIDMIVLEFNKNGWNKLLDVEKG